MAIDGPSGAGKGTVARAVAERLRYRHIDTGAMYRAVAWKALRDGVDLNDTVRRMRDMLQNTIGGNVRIEEPDLADDLWPALIDPTQIELVILNLAITCNQHGDRLAH